MKKLGKCMIEEATEIENAHELSIEKTDGK